MEQIPTYLMQYGVLGVWTITLLYQVATNRKEQKTERAEHVEIIKNVSTHMALVNDNLKDLKDKVSQCHKVRG